MRINRHCEYSEAVPKRFEGIASVTFVPFYLRQTGARTLQNVTARHEVSWQSQRGFKGF
jgi:hypothetical protein